jgi:NAD(P)-dependent dehydrogenase (short-subunit alcohol dehydrogenase family)
VSEAEWESVVAVNLTAVYVLTRAVLPGMIARGGGTIITVASLAALKSGLVGGAPYGAAKAGARNLMSHVHNVFRDQGIRATTILPPRSTPRSSTTVCDRPTPRGERR